MQCAVCNAKDCYQGKDCTQIKSKVKKEYQEKLNKKVMEVALRIEAQQKIAWCDLGGNGNYCGE